MNAGMSPTIQVEVSIQSFDPPAKKRVTVEVSPDESVTRFLMGISDRLKAVGELPSSGFVEVKAATYVVGTGRREIDYPEGVGFRVSQPAMNAA